MTEPDCPRRSALSVTGPNLSEAVILSTCLRTEVYAVVERFHDGVAELQEFLAAVSGSPVDALAEHLHHPLRRRRVRPPVHRRGRSRLGGPRGVGGARPSAPSLGAGAGGAVSGPVLGGALPARGRDGQAGPLRDGHRPRHHVDVPRRGGPRPPAGATAGWSVPGWLVVGAGEMGEGVAQALAGARRRTGWSSRTAPPNGPRRWRRPCLTIGRRGGGGQARSTTSDRCCAGADVVFTTVGMTHPIIDRAMLEAAAAATRQGAGSAAGGRPRCAPQRGAGRLLARRRRAPRHGGPPGCRRRRPLRPARRGDRGHRDRRRGGRALPGRGPGPRRGTDHVRPAVPGSRRPGAPRSRSTSSRSARSSPTSSGSRSTRRLGRSSPSCCISRRWRSSTPLVRREVSDWSRHCARCSTCRPCPAGRLR